jgi:hypothetical protein
MSTDSTIPPDGTTTGSTPAGPPAADPTTGPGAPDLITSRPDTDQDGAVPAEEGEPGWISRHTSLLTTLLVAVIVAALAVTGLVYYRDAQDKRNAQTEAAFRKTVAAQGATLETVECDGDTCAAIVGGQAYTVLVQEDDNGKQHFGVSPYVGD